MGSRWKEAAGGIGLVEYKKGFPLFRTHGLEASRQTRQQTSLALTIRSTAFTSKTDITSPAKMAPIPIALYGMQLEMARKVMEAMLPEYDGEYSHYHPSPCP